MPPKLKLHRPTGKASAPKLQQNLNESNSNISTLLSPEVEQQFEVELCWCIQQLQIALKSGKLNNKQVQDHTKAMNSLMSRSASVVKKRQIMRLSFGDYRAKMAIEDKKTSRSVLNMKVKLATPSKKSVFVKKCRFASSKNTFKFNFDPPKEDDISKKTPKITAECESTYLNKNDMCDKKNSDYHYMPSDNSFRFGFIVNEEL